MEWQIREATASDVAHLAHRLRKEDADECRAASGLPVFDALMWGLAGAKVVVGQHGLPIAIFGVTRMTDVAGAIWLMATDELVSTYATAFAKQSRPMCDQLNEEYPLLCNVVDERNAVHIRWLEWCGFIFINRHPEYGHEKRPFLEFIRIRPCVTL
jgi:hypothetical protein